MSYTEDNIGFHNLLIRLISQVNYSLFSMCVTRDIDVTIGKDNFLYDPYDIREYLGNNFMGKKYWEKEIQRIKFIQRKLLKRNINLLVVFAPGKANVFPEYIPDRFHIEQKKLSNYKYLVQRFTEEEVNFIDFNNLFRMMKDTASYPLYPKCGLHWSNTGVVFAMDSLVHYMERKKGKKMMNFSIAGMNNTNPDLLAYDVDAQDYLNLLFAIPAYEMPHPEMHFQPDTTAYMPKVIFISDSYYWQSFLLAIHEKVFKQARFWYYFNIAYTARIAPGVEIAKIDTLNEIYNSDFVVIMASEANYYRLGYGFLKKFKLLFPEERSKTNKPLPL